MSPVVSNTSPLTNLAAIGRLDLVRDQLRDVAVPRAVWAEMSALPHEGGRRALMAARESGWLRVIAVSDTALPASLRLIGLDAGESEAIALAHEQAASLLLMDERKGRLAAGRLGLTVTGALGILAAARRNGGIPSARAEIARLKSEAGFYVSPEIEAHTLRIAGEFP
jgi:predicted nucleic acid-binding protein